MWFVQTQTYEREIEHPDDPSQKLTVTLRPLNAGDRAEIDDTVRIEVNADSETGEPEAQTQMRLGTMKRLIVERALVDWSIESPKPSPAAIAQLHPKVFEGIFANCTFGTPKDPDPPSPTPAAEPDSGPRGDVES